MKLERLSKNMLKESEMNFTKEQWQLMLAAVIKTRQQYVDGVRLDHCPLCKFGKRVRIYNECANAKSSPLVQTLDAIIGMYVDTLKKREDEK